jgi:hypothetical protein
MSNEQAVTIAPDLATRSKLGRKLSVRSFIADMQ